MLVELSGEFDILYQKVLENVLSRSLTSGRPTLVDLSRVTFMDSQCVRELAIHYQLGRGSLALCDPSRGVELSVAACDLEGCIDFVQTTARRRFRVSAVLARALPDSGLVGERERLLAMVQGRCGAKEPSDLRHRSRGPEA
jgi:anti-anti-sigma factor